MNTANFSEDLKYETGKRNDEGVKKNCKRKMKLGSDLVSAISLVQTLTWRMLSGGLVLIVMDQCLRESGRVDDPTLPL